MNPNKCHLCGTVDPEDDIQEGLCAQCFEDMPVGEWVTATH